MEYQKENTLNLSNYNERLRAINGTLLLMGVAVLAVFGVYVVIDKISRSMSRGNHQTAGITINTDTIPDGNTKQLVRDQAISLSGPRLLDSAGLLYVVPVTLTNLELPENVGIADYTDGLKGSGSNFSGSRAYTSGGYNNLVLYEQRKGQKYQVFNKRTAIDEYDFVKCPAGNFLLVEVSQRDSNKDGMLNRRDLAGLSVYDVGNHVLHDFTFDGMGLHSFKHLENTETVIVRLRVDKNQNGELESDAEPIVMKELNLSTMQMRNFLDPAMIEAMQGLID